MIRAGVGLSTEEDTERAAQEATATALDRAGLGAADWAVVFATPWHRPAYSRMLGAITRESGTSRVIGCSGTGVLASDGEVEGGAGISVLVVSSDTLRASAFLVRGPGDWASAAELGVRELRGGASLFVLLPDPLPGRLGGLLRIIGSLLGDVPIVGGAPSEDGSLGATFEFRGDEVAAGAVAGLHLGGAFRYTIGLTQAHQPLGEPCIVTRAKGSIINELDGLPALKVLLDQLPRPLADDLRRAIRYVSVGLVPAVEGCVRRGEYLVRDIVGIDPPTGSLKIAGRAAEGQSIHFTVLDAERARADLKAMLQSIAPEKTGRRYRFGLYFNCAARGSSLYRIPGVDTAFLGSVLRGVPIAGFFSNAELAPMFGANHIFTYTGVLVLISDPE